MTKLNIAIVAHDAMKRSMLDWVTQNVDTFETCHIYATGTTARIITDVLADNNQITPLKSGPLGGDQQIGSMIADGQLDVLFFFQDALVQQGHDADIKALVRLATLYEVPIACNRTTADYLISSPYFTGEKTPPKNPNSTQAIQDYKERHIQL